MTEWFPGRSVSTLAQDLADDPVLRSSFAPTAQPALWAWTAALAGRDSAPVRILWGPGDSITEGQGATTVADRFVDRVMDQLRTRFPVTGSVRGDYQPGYYAAPGLTDPWTFAGAPNSGGTSFGLGRRSVVLTATGQSMSRSVQGTSVVILHAGAPSTGSYRYSIDGGTPVTVNTVRAGGNLGGIGTSVTLPNTSAHTLLIEWVSGTVYLEGAFVHNGTETKGFQSWEASHYGYRTSDYTSNLGWADTVGTVQPQLVVMGLLTNDYGNQVTPATNLTNLRSLIATVKAKCTLPPSFVLLNMYETAATTPVAPFSEYLANGYALAAEDPMNVTVLDLSTRMPAAPTDVLGLYEGTKVHPTNKGAAVIADALTGFLTPR